MNEGDLIHSDDSRFRDSAVTIAQLRSSKQYTPQQPLQQRLCPYLLRPLFLKTPTSRDQVIHCH